MAILAWTGFDDLASYTRLRALGVRGYLRKPTDSATMIAAVRTLARGGTLISPDPLVEAAEHGIARLSDQEWAVLRRIAAGRSNAAMAEELVIAVSTVEGYLTRLYRKLNVTSRAEAIARGYDVGLLLPADAARAAGLD